LVAVLVSYTGAIMSHSRICCLVHVVFATAERRPCIRDEFRERLHRYVGGSARELGTPALAVGGTRDHNRRLSFAEEMKKFLDVHGIEE
jgi:hypothetical protein